jgi:hypothetical protein
MALGRICLQGERVTTSDRIQEQSFCYDPDFPPSVAEGQPLVKTVAAKPVSDAPVRRALRACSQAASSIAARGRSSS